MKKIIFVIVLIALLAGSFFLYKGQKNLIADDKDEKCCNTECTQKENCQKQCDGKCETCTKQCESMKNTNNEGQSQMKNCPKTNCSQKTEAGSTKGSCTYRK
ncbi:MAG: lipoprotein [Ignavibacteria bacterium]